MGESTTDGSTEGLHKYINYGRHRPLNTTDSTEDHDLFRYPTQLRMAKSASINSPELNAMSSTNLTLPPPKFSVAMKSLSMESLELPENAVTTTTSKGLLL